VIQGVANRVCQRERGDVAPTVILTTLTVFLVMFVIQMGIFFHARTVLNAAAEDATRAAQVKGGSNADAERAIDQMVAGSSSLLTNQRRTVSVDADTVTVAIEADIPSLVPFWSGTVTARSSGPVERFRPEDERRRP
jgi:Flp pilus assembly protein TadG